MSDAARWTVGLLGHPVSHSRSPAMMNAAFRALGIPASYALWDTPPGGLAARVRDLAGSPSWRGANVTVPHKRAALSLAGALSPDAAAVGAANVLAREGPRIVAHNTDAPGAVAALRDAGAEISHACVVVLGAGGAARAVAAGAARAGADAVTVVARDPSAAGEIVRALDALGLPCRARALALADARATREAFARASVAVQTTTVGMSPSTDPPAGAPPALAPELLAAMPRGAYAMDLVYSPVETAWLRAARGAGLRTVDGLGMLAHQGALAVGLWFGVEAPADLLRRFLDGAGGPG